jgi:hypothetical protein
VHAAILNFTGSSVSGQHIISTGVLGRMLVAAPKAAALRACSVGVVVGRGGTEALLALVVAAEEVLEEDGDKEEEAVK